MSLAKLCIQCVDANSGELGTFLAEPIQGANRAVSPVFAGCVELFRWTKVNGWAEAPMNSDFPVGLYQKEAA